jgi:hypothetical protein
MVMREWFARFRRRGEAATVAPLDEAARGTPAERVVTTVDVRAGAADAVAARIAGQTPSEADRLGD